MKKVVCLSFCFLFPFVSCRFSPRIPSTKNPASNSDTPPSGGTASLSLSNGATYDFGNVTVGNTGDKMFTLSNSGTASATNLTGSAFSSSHFVFMGNSYPGTGGTCSTSLSAGSTCTVTVTFTPQSSGAKTDTLTLSYHNGTSTTSATRALAGTGLSVASLSISDGTTYDYGTVNTGQTSDKTFTVTNSGEATATSMSGAAFSTGDFLFVGSAYPGGGTCGSSLLGSNSTCTVIVQFAPSSTGSKSDTITVNYHTGSAAATATRAVQGTGGTPGPSGALDTSFYTSGAVSTDFSAGVDETVKAIQSQTDGKLLLGRGFYNETVTRLLSSGGIDTTFATDGSLSSPAALANNETPDFAIDTSGKTYAPVHNPSVVGQQSYLYRLLTDGSVDTTFNTAGYVTTTHGNGIQGVSVALNAQQKPVFQAISADAGLAMMRNIRRYESNGSFDTSFSTDGKTTWMPSGAPTSTGNGKVRFDEDGRIVSMNYEAVGVTSSTKVLRLTTDGQLDTTFNSVGYLTTTLLTQGYSMALDTMGRAVVVGFQAGASHSLLRLRTDGPLDTAFATTGNPSLVTGAAPARSVLVQGTKVVILGADTISVRMSRLTSDGVLDTSFSTNGNMTNGALAGEAAGLTFQSGSGNICGAWYNTGPTSQTKVFCVVP